MAGVGCNVFERAATARERADVDRTLAVAARSNTLRRSRKRTILRLGARRFGSVARGNEAAVKAIQDRARLERIIDRILDATGWDDLLATP